LRAVNLFEIYQALSTEEKYIFIELTEKDRQRNCSVKRKKKPILSNDEAIQYLTSKVFK
jgi:hypothetical protein